MRILASVNAHIRKPKCAYTKSLFRICAFWLPYMRIYGRKKCAYTEAKMRIYGRELPYMCILASVYAHLRKPKCAYTEALYTEESFRKCAYTEDKMRIYRRELSYMRIYGRKKCAFTEAKMRIYIYGRELPYMHILASVNLSSVYAHFGFRKCAFTEAKMRIYGRKNVHIRKRASVYAHLRKEKMRIYGKQKCAFMEALFHICTFFLPYMRIYGSQNAHIRKLSSVYRASICAFTEAKMRIYEASIYMRIMAFWPKCAYTEDKCAYTEDLPYMHILASVCTYTEAKMCIYESSLPYMHILASVYAHLRKEKMRIYGSQNAHIRKRAFVYVHFGFRICTFTEAKMHIYGLRKEKMCIMTYGTMTSGTMKL
jgi:hypothetical protein